MRPEVPQSLVGKQRTQQVRQVTQQPFGEKEYAEPRGALEGVVLVYLGQLGKQP